jgi:hypothetical protein
VDAADIRTLNWPQFDVGVRRRFRRTLGPFAMMYTECSVKNPPHKENVLWRVKNATEYRIAFLPSFLFTANNEVSVHVIMKELFSC